MLQAGGIDKLVEQKADAYRGNPQALQKRYSQNQELMDLLAMQKLKTEKEAASRDMQLKAEQTPSTIAEQYEQQLVSMNKNEMAGQVAGVLGQKQKQAQQKQQAMGMPPQAHRKASLVSPALTCKAWLKVELLATSQVEKYQKKILRSG